MSETARTQPRTSSGTFFRGSRVPRNATYREDRNDRCAWAAWRSFSPAGWNCAGSTPWWATSTWPRNRPGHTGELVQRRPGRDHAAVRQAEAGVSPAREEDALGREMDLGMGEERRVVQRRDDREAGPHRHRVVRAVQDVGPHPGGEPR